MRVLPLVVLAISACAQPPGHPARDPARAERAIVDRFSDAYGRYFRRSIDPSLPGPDEPIDFDDERFVVTTRGPRGETVTQYRLDARPLSPIVLYHTLYARTHEPVAAQPSILDYVPGDEGASDFWQLVNVLVPDDFVPHTLTSVDDVIASGYALESTRTVVNCPVVPDGSTATRQFGGSAPELHLGWYRDRVVHYFTFAEATLEVGEDGIPTAALYVPVGWPTAPPMLASHDVVAALPGEPGYSPLWRLNVYALDEHDAVVDLKSAERATPVPADRTTLNWPIVAVATP